MNANARIVTTIGGAVLMAVLLRLAVGPWGGAAAPSLYAEAKIGAGAEVAAFAPPVELAARAGPTRVQ